MLGKPAKYRLCFNIPQNIVEYIDFNPCKKCDYTSNIPVSYTHLDVYKRQGIWLERPD